MTFQLNVNLGFENGGTWYVYWIQDVALVDTATSTVYQFENNVWNFSSSSTCLSNSAVTGNGQVYPVSGCVGYYAFGVSSTPALVYPGSFQMQVNSSVDSLGQPVVRFMYNDGPGWVSYDTVTFSFVHSLDYSDGFIVDGAEYNPTGYLYYDAEFVMGGPGGGTSTTDQSSSVDLFLAYWNGNNYETVNDALNYGFDTAETIASADSQGYYYTASGVLFSQVTAGTESQLTLWYSSDLAIVDIEGPGSCNAALLHGSAATTYLAGFGAIAIWPITVSF